MHSPKRFPNRTTIGLIANAMFCKTVRQNHWPVDRPNHLQSADSARVPRQLVPAMSAGNRLQNLGFSEHLQHFSQQRDRQMVSVGDVFGTCGRTWHARQMSKGDETVIRFFGELEQLNQDTFGPDSMVALRKAHVKLGIVWNRFVSFRPGRGQSGTGQRE